MAAMTGPAQKPKNFKATMRTLLRYMRPYRTSVIIVLILAVASTAFAIVSPKILGNVTNIIVSGYVIPAAHLSQRPGIDYSAILKLVQLLIVLYLISASFNYLQSWIMTGVSQKLTFNLRRDIAAKMNRLPLRYYDTRTHGEVLSRVTNDVDTVSQTLNQSLIQIVTSATTLIGILVMMLTISWQMTLVALVILPISFSLIGLVVRKSQNYFITQQKTLGQINGHVEEMFSGHTIMKAFNGEARSTTKFSGINNELYKSAWKAQFYSGLLMPIMSFVGNLSYVGVAVLGGWLAINGRIRIGDIQAFIQYMNQFTQPIMQTANIANVLQSTAAAAERVFEFLSEKEEITDIANPVELTSVKGGVTFDHVMFGYKQDIPIIKDFTANILPGQKVAIVGPTGAGKTTLVNLLMRFYDVDAGSIKVDNVDIRDMKRAEVRSLFGMVLQDTWLFTGTIEENIAYGKTSAAHTGIVSAAEAAHADHFIRSLPGGYQMKLNEEADNISQGEKQLLTIARAMLADAPMLILDEATSSVDTRTELLIQKAMDQLMEGRTSFIIAHRLSTIKNADLIFVMKDGSIVEQGRHEQLLSQNGYYASLYNSQFARA
jgi:ATP-binding cassette subfamily B protein